MSRYAFYLASACAFALTSMIAFSGCGDECSSGSDCGSGEVCYLGTCSALDTPVCEIDMDCNPNGGDRLACLGGRCTFRSDAPIGPTGPTGPTGMRDGGPNRDGGPRDAGPVRDGGPGRDAGPRDGGSAPDGGPSNGTLTVSIDGVMTSFNNATSAVFTTTPTVGTTIRGTAMNGDTLELFHDGGEPIAGMATCGPGSPDVRITLVQGGTTYMTTVNCNINITVHGQPGTTLMGSFAGSLVNGATTRALTNGLMSIVVGN